MTSMLSKTPEPSCRKGIHKNDDGGASSANSQDLFSPRSAAAMALSSISRQSSEGLDRPTNGPSTSSRRPSSAGQPSVRASVSMEEHSMPQSTMRRSPPDYPQPFYERHFEPIPPVVPSSAVRRHPVHERMHPSPPHAVRFHYPPHHPHFPHKPVHMHPMAMANHMPPQSWTPSHRGGHSMPSSGHRHHHDGMSQFRQPMMHPHTNFGAWEHPHPMSVPFYPNAPPQSHGPPMSHTRPASEMNSFVTPTPKKARTGDDKDYNRKKKSLGLLAETFLERFSTAEQGTEVYIDRLANELQVERRRIYDVVNILESLRIVMKKAKNAYHWMGTSHLPCMFALLQHDAIYEHAQDAFELGIIATKPSDEEIHAARANHDSKETKSLSRLSQLFLRCYLVGHETLSLPQASDKIHGEQTSMEDLAELGVKNHGEVVPTDPKLFQQAAMRGLKTKIRRLYDIANVFISMGLLVKVDERAVPLETRRPRFSWSYRLSAQDIAQVYNHMPDSMKRDRDPFQVCELPPDLVGKQQESLKPAQEANSDTPGVHHSFSQVSTVSSSSNETKGSLSVDRDIFNHAGNHHENEHDAALFSNINLTGGAVEATTGHRHNNGELARLRFENTPGEKQ